MEFSKLLGSDIDNIHSFKDWIKNQQNFKDLYQDLEVPDNHIKIFIRYLREQVLKTKEIQNDLKHLWLQKLRNIDEVITVKERSSNETI